MAVGRFLSETPKKNKPVGLAANWPSYLAPRLRLPLRLAGAFELVGH